MDAGVIMQAAWDAHETQECAKCHLGGRNCSFGTSESLTHNHDTIHCVIKCGFCGHVLWDKVTTDQPDDTEGEGE